jgi:uncharacterized membrane protein
MEFLAQFHPKIVHFPIAFLLIYVLLEITGVFSKKEYFQKTAYLFLFLGVLSAVAAVITGNQAAGIASRLEDKGVIIPLGLISEHEEYATINLWYFTGVLVLRTFLVLKKKFKGIYHYIFIVIAIAGAYLIYQTADYGGKLVFEHGVGTEIQKEKIK